MRVDASAARALSTPPATTSETGATGPAAAGRTGAVPEPAGKSAKSYDGMLVGANGQVFNPATTSLQDVPAVQPQNGQAPRGTTIFVNGINTQPGGAANQMQTYANTTGNQVVGVYNATEGMLKDIIQSAGDKFDIGKNKAVDNLSDLIYSELQAGRPVQIAGYSQGAVITERALTDVKNRLMLEGGMSRSDAERAMSNVTVETFGGAGSNFPDGPKYTHYVNRADVVPQLFGVGAPFSDPGAGAEVRKFNTWNPFKAHGWDKYMNEWRPPNQNNGLNNGGGGGSW